MRYLIVKRFEEMGLEFGDIQQIFKYHDQEETEYIQEYLENSGIKVKAKDIDDIINVLNPDRSRINERYGTPRREDSKHARKIIDTVKLGIFPGDYYPK